MKKRLQNLFKISLISTALILSGCDSTQGFVESAKQIGNNVVDGSTNAFNKLTGKREETPEQKERSRNRLVDSISVVSGVLVAAVCGNKQKNNTYTGTIQEQQVEKLKDQAICAGAGLITGYAINVLGKTITEGLKEEEQREVLVAANRSLQSGEPELLEFPESNVTIKITPNKETFTRTKKFKIGVEQGLLDDGMLTQLNVIGKVYEASSSEVAASKGGKSLSLTTKNGNEYLAMGSVGDLILLGEYPDASNSGDYSALVARGFVSKDKLKESDLIPFDLPNAVFNVDVEEVAIEAIVTCSLLTMEKAESGTQDWVSETPTTCIGIDGLATSPDDEV